MSIKAFTDKPLIKILWVDDDSLILEGYKQLVPLYVQNSINHVADTVEKAMVMLMLNQYDLVFLDSMEDDHWINIMRTAILNSPAVKVIGNSADYETQKLMHNANLICANKDLSAIKKILRGYNEVQ